MMPIQLNSTLQLKTTLKATLNYTHAKNRWIPWLFGYNEPLSDSLHALNVELQQRLSGLGEKSNINDVLQILEKTVRAALQKRDETERTPLARETKPCGDPHHLTVTRRYEVRGHFTGEFEKNIKEGLIKLKEFDYQNSDITGADSALKRIDALIDKINHHKQKVIRVYWKTIDDPAFSGENMFRP